MKQVVVVLTFEDAPGDPDCKVAIRNVNEMLDHISGDPRYVGRDIRAFDLPEVMVESEETREAADYENRLCAFRDKLRKEGFAAIADRIGKEVL